MRVGEGLPERVFERALSKAQPLAQPADHVRRLAHALGAAGQHDVGFAEQDHLRAADRRLNAGPAEAIDGERRHVDRHAGFEPDVARAVDRVGARLQHVAEHDVVDLIRARRPSARTPPGLRWRRGRARRCPSARPTYSAIGVRAPPTMKTSVDHYPDHLWLRFRVPDGPGWVPRSSFVPGSPGVNGSGSWFRVPVRRRLD